MITENDKNIINEFLHLCGEMDTPLQKDRLFITLCKNAPLLNSEDFSTGADNFWSYIFNNSFLCEQFIEVVGNKYDCPEFDFLFENVLFGKNKEHVYEYVQPKSIFSMSTNQQFFLKFMCPKSILSTLSLDNKDWLYYLKENLKTQYLKEIDFALFQDKSNLTVQEVFENTKQLFATNDQPYVLSNRFKVYIFASITQFIQTNEITLKPDILDIVNIFSDRPYTDIPFPQIDVEKMLTGDLSYKGNLENFFLNKNPQTYYDYGVSYLSTFKMLYLMKEALINTEKNVLISAMDSEKSINHIINKI